MLTKKELCVLFLLGIVFCVLFLLGAGLCAGEVHFEAGLTIMCLDALILLPIIIGMMVNG